MSHFVITGAKCGTTQGASAANRREINDLTQDQQQFSLYCTSRLSVSHFRCIYRQAVPLALERLRCFRHHQSNELSHFAVGGIHGLAFVPWDGSGGSNPVQESVALIVLCFS